MAKTIFHSLAALDRKIIIVLPLRAQQAIFGLFLTILLILGPGNESERERGTTIRAKIR